MLKKILLIFLMLSFLPVLAGELEDAIKKEDYIFVYLHSPDCGYCRLCSPIFKKLSTKYNKSVKFLSFDASKRYGNYILWKYQGSYVPYSFLISTKNNKAYVISPNCMLEYSCTENIIKQIVK